MKEQTYILSQEDLKDIVEKMKGKGMREPEQFWISLKTAREIWEGKRKYKWPFRPKVKE